MTERVGYGFETIRDFLEQLECELERTALGKRPTPDGVEQMRKFKDKYGRLLVPLIYIEPEGSTAEELMGSVRKASDVIARRRKEQFDCLQRLRGLFREVFEFPNGRVVDGTPVRNIKASEFLLE